MLRTWHVRLALTVWVVLLVFVGGGGSLQAEIPHSPDSYTLRKFREANYAFYKRNTVGAYLQYGQRDERWDDAAVHFLDAVSKHLSKVDGAPTEEELFEIIVGLRDVRCPDVLVQTMCSRFAYEVARRRVDKELMKRDDRGFWNASLLLIRSKYPPFHKYLACRHGWEMVKREKRGVGAERDMVNYTVKFAIQLGRSDLYREGEARLLSAHLHELFYDGFPNEDAKLVINGLAEDGPDDPWLVTTLRGVYQIRAAWKSRGGGWANTVTEEGWRGFSEHLERAREDLTRAWEMHPDRPEPASDMIRVSMGAPIEDSATEMRLWFDRAVAAQLDFAPAYTHMFWGLRPRWGGSHEQMYSFAVECAETDRYDTQVPGYLINALADICEEYGESGADPYEFWKREGVYARVKRMLDGYIEEPRRWWPKESYLTYMAGFGWATKHYDDGREALDRLGDRLDRSAAGALHIVWDQVLSDTHAYTGPLAKEYRHSLNMAYAGKYRQAIAGFDSLASDERNTPVAAARAASRSRSLRDRMAFDRGRWVSLAGEEGLAGWVRVAGTWEADEAGGLVGTSSADGLAILCDTIFGNDFELVVTIEVLESVLKGHYPGVIFGYYQAAEWPVLLVNPKTKRVEVSKMGDANSKYGGGKKCHGPVDARLNHVRVQCRNGIAKVWLNDELVFPGVVIRDRDLGNMANIGLGGHYWWPGAKLRFSEVKIRRFPVVERAPERKRGHGPPPAPR